MSKPVYHIVGSYLSPYVRKVLVCMGIKGLRYTIDPIAPFLGGDDFEKLSPLRRIPVLIDGPRVINDSSVICQYLEDRHPTPSLYPADIGERAQARWLEEYADARLGEVIVAKMFYQRGPKRFLFKEDLDEASFNHARDVDLPACLDWLEPQMPQDGYLLGALSIADLSIASFFRNAGLVRFEVDAARWPRTAAWLRRTLGLPEFVRLAKIEDTIARVPLTEQATVLRELGEPVTQDTLGTSTPRKGVMRLD
ncbi:glutathione S-transferase family protein [Pseudoxanthomonas sp.]|uniref:glutathione S-transferase family protein n=1 Tax=Pseudoxanthomonas sp. TaxID=1871049 RepID=UPI0026142742|nr:glutathione S-transferase family protein [Pseudoxanthomonas sp.]WDS35118.1 MAG: glutathione S-transferase family protein [Pseudoxanthomonas sp.]